MLRDVFLEIFANFQNGFLLDGIDLVFMKRRRERVTEIVENSLIS